MSWFDRKKRRPGALGPLLQLGLTDDLALVGLSEQGEYVTLLSALGEQFKLILQGGIGFGHVDG